MTAQKQAEQAGKLKHDVLFRSTLCTSKTKDNVNLSLVYGFDLVLTEQNFKSPYHFSLPALSACIVLSSERYIIISFLKYINGSLATDRELSIYDRCKRIVAKATNGNNMLDL